MRPYAVSPGCTSFKDAYTLKGICVQEYFVIQMYKKLQKLHNLSRKH